VDDKSLYAAIPGLTEPWGVEKVELRVGAGKVHVWVALPKETLWVCPECLAAAPIHDHREREWRHLDTCQYGTLVHARVPRDVLVAPGERRFVDAQMAGQRRRAAGQAAPGPPASGCPPFGPTQPQLLRHGDDRGLLHPVNGQGLEQGGEPRSPFRPGGPGPGGCHAWDRDRSGPLAGALRGR
jgi:zinc-finger of transposase IS204/IS1001/IS1096/IS1165